MFTVRKLICLMVSFLFVASCSKNQSSAKKEIWIYTSLYNSVINQLKPELAKKFPEFEVKWFQSGSEKVAARVNAELAAGNAKADLIMTSDPFWYESLKQQGKLLAYKSKQAEYLPSELRDPDGHYDTVRICAMVMSYNKDVLKTEELPTTFKELVSEKWKAKVALGSPLESGTNFTTVATLSQSYGWDYYKQLRKLETFSSGGNSTVRRKIESKEFQIGVILLENLLKAKEGDSSLGIIYPRDGTVLIPSPLAIMKNTKHPEDVKKLYDFFMGKEGQQAMVKAYMYSAHPEVAAPKGALSFQEVWKNSFPWNHKFIGEVLLKSEEIKNQYAKIMFE